MVAELVDHPAGGPVDVVVVVHARASHDRPRQPDRSVHRLVWPSLSLEFLDHRCDPAPDSSAFVIALASENRGPGSRVEGCVLAVPVDDELGGAVDVEIGNHPQQNGMFCRCGRVVSAVDRGEHVRGLDEGAGRLALVSLLASMTSATATLLSASNYDISQQIYRQEAT